MINYINKRHPAKAEVKFTIVVSQRWFTLRRRLKQIVLSDGLHCESAVLSL